MELRVAERRVWQQWKAVAAIWAERVEAAATAAEIASVDWDWFELDEEAAAAEARAVSN